MRFDELFIGQRSAVSKTITLADIQAFADLTGDFSAMHFDEGYARDSRFGGIIAHGMMTAGLLSTVMGMHLPGRGVLSRSQSLRFRAPVYPGDTITATVEVLELRPDRKQVRLATVITNQNGVVVIDGEAEMLMME